MNRHSGGRHQVRVVSVGGGSEGGDGQGDGGDSGDDTGGPAPAGAGRRVRGHGARRRRVAGRRPLRDRELSRQADQAAATELRHPVGQALGPQVRIGVEHGGDVVG
jgi:hypothetical protein